MSKADSARVHEYLQHILDAIQRIDRYVEDLSEVTFLSDEKTQDAVIRNFEIIGEACNNITKHHADFAESHAEIPWDSPIKYAMLWRMATLKWIWK